MCICGSFQITNVAKILYLTVELLKSYGKVLFLCKKKKNKVNNL